MIQELKKRDFPAIEKIMSSAEDLPEVLAIVRGVNPGRVFVDDAVTPKAALVWSQGIEGFYLVGNARIPSFSKHLDEYVGKVFASQVQSLGLDCFEVSSDRTAWDEAIKMIFAGRSIERSRQCVYRLNFNTYKTDVLSPIDTKRVRKLDSDLLSDSQLKNQEFLRSKLNQFWIDYDAFLSAGIGYAVVHKRVIASLCFSAFVAGAIHVVDIETTPMHRCRGFARMAATAFLHECSERQFQPHWDCMSDNNASRRLAESVGFEKVREYTLHSFRLGEDSG